MDALALNSTSDDALREENWQLKQLLRGSESSQRRLERHNRALQRRVQQLEAQLSTRRHREQQGDAKSEREWIVEHDNKVRALLHIIRHHEAAKEELQREVQQLRAKVTAAATVVKVSRSAQTDGSHGRWSMVSEEGSQEPSTQANACIKNLRDQLQYMPSTSSRCSVPSRQESLVCSAALTPPIRSDFRSSVMKRLSQRQPPHRPVVRPLPIPEGDEEEEEHRGRHKNTPQDSQSLGIDQNSIEVEAESPSRRLRHYRGLEEQNQRLKERLESQQSLLDQLLSIKLDQVSSPPSSKLIRSAPAPSKKVIQGSEQAGTSSSASFLLPEPAQTSSKLDKQPTIANRDLAVQLSSTPAMSNPRSPQQQPHPMSPPAA